MLGLARINLLFSVKGLANWLNHLEKIWRKLLSIPSWVV